MYGSHTRKRKRKNSHGAEILSESDMLRNAKQMFSEQTADIQEHQGKLLELEAQLTACSGFQDIRKARIIAEEIQDIKDIIHKKQDGATHFVKKAKSALSLPSKNPSRKAILGGMCGPSENVEPIQICNEKCQECGNACTFSHDISCIVCQSCASIVPTIRRNELGMHEATSTFGTSGYERHDVYRRYLECNFSETTDEIPQDVLGHVHMELTKVHMMVKAKVRPTPVVTILRKCGMQKWCNHSVRISKILNGEPIPRMSQGLIDVLVWRFAMVSNVFNQIKEDQSSRKKILSFEFLTHKFLLLENEVEMSKTFSSHKTRSVLNDEENRLRQTFERIVEMDASMNWKFPSRQ